MSQRGQISIYRHAVTYRHRCAVEHRYTVTLSNLDVGTGVENRYRCAVKHRYTVTLSNIDIVALSSQTSTHRGPETSYIESDPSYPQHFPSLLSTNNILRRPKPRDCPALPCPLLPPCPHGDIGHGATGTTPFLPLLHPLSSSKTKQQQQQQKLY